MRTLAVLFALSLFAAPARALDRDPDGFFHTGSGVRVKKVAFIKVKVYAIDHYIKELPAQKSKPALIDADVDKRFSWRMLRTVDAERIQKALREAYELNGYKDKGKIDTMVGGLAKELKEGDKVTISYDAAKKTTTLTSPSGSASVPGVDFMHATWSIWFGQIDQPNLGNELLSRW